MTSSAYCRNATEAKRNYQNITINTSPDLEKSVIYNKREYSYYGKASLSKSFAAKSLQIFQCTYEALLIPLTIGIIALSSGIGTIYCKISKG